MKKIPMEEALYIFRKNFPLTRGINVQESSISYTIGNYATKNDFVKMAENVIATFNLPLSVNTWSGDLSIGVLIVEAKN